MVRLIDVLIALVHFLGRTTKCTYCMTTYKNIDAKLISIDMSLNLIMLCSNCNKQVKHTLVVQRSAKIIYDDKE